MQEYEVTVTITNIFETNTPEEAVTQMVAWLDESAHAAGYRVTWSENTDGEFFFDAEKINR